MLIGRCCAVRPGNSIGKEGAQHISEGLTKNCSLRKLNLGGNGIGDEGVEQIALALTKNDTLLRLDLDSK